MGISWFPSLLFALSYWLVISSLGALFVTIWGLGLRYVISKKYNLFVQIISAIAIWCCLEYFFQQSPFWWTSLALTQSPGNLWLLQLNQISGASTTIALILAINGLLANLIYLQHRKIKRKLGIIVILILLASHLIGGFLYYLPDTSSAIKLSIGIIQGDIPIEIKFKEEGINLALERYLQGYQKLVRKGVEGVLTPELAIPPLGQHHNIKITPFFVPIQQAKIPFWIGTRTGDKDNPKQSLVALEDSGFTTQYNKQKMVLFGETIPFFDTPLEPLIRKIFPFKTHHLTGSRKQIFTTPYGNAAVAICYESAYPEIFLNQVRAGGKFIMVATADGLFGNQMKTQHHAQDILRAVETRRWLVRANSQDYSGVIDSKGNTIWISEPGYQLHKSQIYLSDYKSAYVLFGDWLSPFLAIVSIYCLFKQGQN